ncbi:MAG: nucleoside permease [Pseudomonadota bacterium]
MQLVMCLFVAAMSAVVIWAGLTKTTLKPLVYTKLTLMMLAQYFIWGVYFVTMATYMSKHLGFADSDIGQIYSVNNIAGILSPFIIGMIADRFFSAQKVLAIMHIVGGVMIFLVGQTTTPGAFYWLFMIYSLMYMPTIALTNSISFYQMKEPGKEFPFIRVWGTIGWILAGLIVGFAKVEETNMPMILCSVVSILSGILCFFLPSTPPKGAGTKVTISDILGLKALRLFKDRSFAVFAISSCLISIPLAFYYAFTNLFLNEVGMQQTAAKMTMGQMSEIIFMIIMPFFFFRLGIKKMLIVGMSAWALRYLLFAFGNTDSMVWMLYLGVILHGVCYDFFFVTGQIYVDKSAPLEIQSQAQGLICLLTYGVGMFLGSIVSGYIVQHFKTEIMHNWAAIWLCPFVMALIIMICFSFLFKERNTEEKINIH